MTTTRDLTSPHGGQHRYRVSVTWTDAGYGPCQGSDLYRTLT